MDPQTCTAAIVGQDRAGARRVIGGGVCLRVAGQPFLLSAGDVLTAVGEQAWIGVGGRILPLYGAAILGYGPHAPPEARGLNIGFAPLVTLDIGLPQALDCITVDAVDLEEDRAGEEYVAVAPVEPGGAAWAVTPARAAPRSAYRACGVDAATHLVVDVEGAADGSGGLGCGLWRGAGVSGARLTGIATGRRPIDGGRRTRVVATRAPLVVLGVLGFLGVRPERWLAKAGRPARRTH